MKGIDSKIFKFSVATILTKIKKYFLIIFCLFLMHIALFFIYINIFFSSNERHSLSVYFKAKILSHYEFTSDIKVKKNINGKEFVLGAKYMRDALNDPFIKPDIDSLINTTRRFFFISSSVYIFLLYFVFTRHLTVKTEFKSSELDAPKISFEPPAQNILAEKNSSKKSINENSLSGKALKNALENPAVDLIRQSEVREKSDSHIDKNIIADEGLTEEDFLL